MKYYLTNVNPTRNRKFNDEEDIDDSWQAKAKKLQARRWRKIKYGMD